MKKRMTAAEFRDEDYLQEVNRRLLHPLGLPSGLSRRSSYPGRAGS